MMEFELKSDLERLNISFDDADKEKMYINFISVIDKRNKKEAIKLLSTVSTDDAFVSNIENWFVQKLTSKDLSVLKKLSPLLELSDVTRNIIRRNFVLLCQYLGNLLSMLCDEKESQEKILNSENRSHYATIAVKTCLQLIQLLPDAFLQSISSTDICKILGEIFSNIILILSSKLFTKECSLLAGTTMALLFNISSEYKETFFPVLDVLNFLGKLNVTEKKTSWKNMVIHFPKVVPSDVSTLLFINGFTTTNSVLLIQETSSSEALLNVMFRMINVELYDDPVSKYICFQTLLSWLNYINQGNLNNVLLKLNVSFIDKDSFYCNQIFDWVWKHMEDLVDGIPSLVRKIFALTLKLHCDERCIKKIEPSDDDLFYYQLAEDIFELPWHVKGRWSLLTELIPFLSYKKIILMRPCLIDELLRCLTTCGLTAVSNDVYQSILKDMKSLVNDNNLAKKEWSEIFYAPLVIALQNDNVILRQNIGQYWFPSTAKLLPDCLLIAEKEVRSLLMENKTVQLFHAYILIIKSCRSNALIRNENLSDCEDLLSQALSHSDLEIRMETFTTLCCNPKKTEPLPISFQGLLLNFVEDNLNNDSSRFRQQILSSLKKIVINIRESSVLLHRKYLDAIKRGKTDEISKQLLENLIKFIQRLLTISKSCLHPGAIFQRKKTGLLLFQLISELFVFVNDEKIRKKCAAPDSTLNFFNFLNKENHDFDIEKLDVISSIDLELLSCIEDQHDEIRELALEILDYHQVLSEDRLLSDTQQFTSTMNIALLLLDSPKYHNTESGAMIIRFIFNRLVDNSNLRFLPENFHSDKTESNDTDFMSICWFLLERGKKYCLKVDEDFLKAASQQPVFGIFLAFSQILICLTKKKYQSNLSNLSVFIRELVILCDSMSSLTVQLLSGTYVVKNGNDCAEASPSFADIDGALDVALQNCPSYYFLKKSLGHLHCRELLVSFCWLNLKAISCVLGGVGNLVSSLGTDGLLLEMETLGLIYNYYKNSLIKCRHKGVIEGALVSLTFFAKYLSSVSLYWKEMKNWCSSVLHSAVDMSQTASVTKRSAGIPMFILAILTAEPTTENKELLHQTIRYLLEVAKTELPTNINMTVDLPQFNAINIIRAIFRDASLGNTVLSMVEDVLMLTIDGFSSVSWSIRNASTILLGTLVPRMLGQRISQEESNLQNTSTVDVFFYRYRKLASYFQNCLEIQKDVGDGYEANFITPHVIPVLTFLSKLSSGEKQCKLYKTFTPILNSFLASPVFTIRELASTAIISFTPQNDYVKFVEQTIQEISSESNRNKIHGQCMVLFKSIRIATKCRTDICITIYKHYQKNCVFTSLNCDLQSLGIVIDILIECYNSMKNDTKIFGKYMKSMISYAKMLTTDAIGKTHFYKALSKAVVLFLCKEEDHDLLEQVLNNKSNDLHLFFFKFVNQSVLDINNNMKSLILQFNLKTILESNSDSLLDSSLTCFHSILNKKTFSEICDISSILSRLFELLNSSLRFIPVLLPLLQKMLSYCQYSFQVDKTTKIENDDYLSMIGTMTNFVDKYSCSTVGEDLRLAAAQTLSLFKQLILIEEQVESSSSLKDSLRIVLTSAVILLQDEDEDVRKEANSSLQFINDLVNYNRSFLTLENCHANTKNQPSVQFNITLKNLFKFVERRALTDKMYFLWLADILVGIDYCDNVESSMMLFDQEASNLYAEEMVLTHLTFKSLDSILTGLATYNKEHFLVYFSIFQTKFYFVFKKEIEWLRKMLQSKPSNKSIYGVLGSRKCFIAINRLVGWMNMVFHHSTNKGKVEIKELYMQELAPLLKTCPLPLLLIENCEKIK